MPEAIADRLEAVRRQLQQYCQQAKRDESGVRLLAVSKTQPVTALQAAYAAGQRDFGENYVQEALAKIQQLPKPDVVWHFIGPIQSNKTQAIAEHFAWVHSVDRLKIAERLNVQRPEGLPPLNVCVQVNIDQEPSKSGVSLAELPSLLSAMMNLPRLRVRGLMAIPAPTEDLQQQRKPFAQLRTALHECNRRYGWALDTLSMGMSKDQQAAVLEGATWVRVGTAVFGQRVC